MSLKLRVLNAYYSERQLYQQAVPQAKPQAEGSLLGPLLLGLITIIWAAAFAFDFNFSLWIFVGMGLILALVGLLHPVAGLLGVGLLIAIEPVVRVYLPETGFFRWNTVLYWLLVVMLLHLPSILRMNDFQTRLLQALILLLALELMFSTRITKGVQQVLDITSMFAIVIYFARVLGKQDALYWLGIVVGTFSALGGLVFNLQINELPYLNPNSWAFFPLTGIFMISLAFLEAKHSSRRMMLLVFLFAVNYAWIFLSGSRGNMLSGMIALLFILWQVRRMPWLVILMALSAMLGYWITTQMEAQSLYALERVELFFDPSSTLAHRTSGRSTLLRGALQIFQDHPLGVGTGSFNDTFAEIDRWGRAKTSHSAWLAVLAENGIPGILLLVSYVVSFTLVGWTRRKQGLFELGLFVTLLMSVVFISKEFYARGLWMTAAAATVLLNSESMLRALPKVNPRKVLQRYPHLKNGWHEDRNIASQDQDDHRQAEKEGNRLR